MIPNDWTYPQGVLTERNFGPIGEMTVPELRSSLWYCFHERPFPIIVALPPEVLKKD